MVDHAYHKVPILLTMTVAAAAAAAAAAALMTFKYTSGKNRQKMVNFLTFIVFIKKKNMYSKGFPHFFFNCV
jgi:hypothetical protein